MEGVPMLRRTWRRHARVAVLVANGLMILVVALRLVPAVEAVLFDPRGGIDLRWYHGLIHDWFAGIPLYHRESVSHPPALFLLLWPIYGWLPVEAARWLYVATTVPVLAGFVVLLLRGARPATRDQGVFLALLVFACYPTAQTIANGQTTLHLLLALLAGLLLLLRTAPGLGRDAPPGALFVFALAKPNLTLPFLWIALFSCRAVRPLAFAGIGYVAATVVAAELHGSGPVGTVLAWLGNLDPDPETSGYGNLHAWLTSLALDAWILPASAIVLAVQGIWMFRHRAADPWILIGVAAIVARVWAYHRLYDDLLLIFPVIALYRLSVGTGESPRGDFAAGVVLVAGCAALGFGALTYHAPIILVAIWLAELAFLARHAGLKRGTAREAIPRGS